MLPADFTMIIPLADAINARKYGAKAANLAKLVAAGFAVPRGFVVSADACRAHLWESGMRQQAAAVPDAEHRETIRAAMLDGQIPEDIRASIAEAYKRLAWRTGLQDPKVAIRPSALDTAADYGGFAGAYETCLNVAGLESVYTAIKWVWASLWSGAAAACRIRFGSVSDPAMAVIVQLMIPAQHSGAVFTADPATGNPHSTVITAKRQDGTSARFAVDLNTMSVSEAADAPQQSMPSDLVGQIAEQAILIEENVGGRISSEWAVDREGIWILQADPMRNLPAYFPLIDAGSEGVSWKRLDAQPISFFARGVATRGNRITLNGYLYEKRATSDLSDERARLKETDASAAAAKEWEKRICPEMNERVTQLLGCDRSNMDSAALSSTLKSAVEVAGTAYDWFCRSHNFLDLLSGSLAKGLGSRELLWKVLGGLPSALLDRDAVLQELAERFVAAENTGKIDDQSWWRSYKSDVERFAGDYVYAFKYGGEAADVSRWRSWVEDSDAVYRIISGVSKRGNSASLVTLNCSAGQDAEIAQAEYPHCKKLIQLCRKWIACRAEVEQVSARACTALRLTVVELAARLAQAGAISDPQDIFYLTADELVQLTDADYLGFASKIAQRKHKMWLERRLIAPELVVDGDQQTKIFADELTGASASGGVVTGRVRIVRSLEEASEIEHGEILISPFQGSVWAPFLAVAGGYICGDGDDMSAEAIAARVYEIPAIMSCKGIMRFKNGQKVTLDGACGQIKVW